ncbi:bifunctional 4-hydroxy-2-oxoglutarate aldolase/2-dehydro-3-deoxy-phosphogluconate aldolase [candidate division KSB1 bacterium]|nr:bifunctional 4-hydroxy-2-oxoglutarate aldolase/2-dehydro-3-deoxy-phosphogluconate aldolase [candidate division KSB1 bacterium]
MQEILEKIGKLGVLPVIKIDDAKNAIPLARALKEGGLPAAEVTFRTNAAEESIRRITGEFPDMFVGAGTVLSIEQAKTAISAGVKFIVAPGFNPKVVDYCLSQGMLMAPGIATPSELEAAMEKGLKTVKFFPAEAIGGLDYLKSMSAPYSGVKFMPTGGINSENILAYLRFSKVLACGGSWMVKDELIAAQKFDKITELVAEAVKLVAQR